MVILNQHLKIVNQKSQFYFKWVCFRINWKAILSSKLVFSQKYQSKSHISNKTNFTVPFLLLCYLTAFNYKLKYRKGIEEYKSFIYKSNKKEIIWEKFNKVFMNSCHDIENFFSNVFSDLFSHKFLWQ
jgi:hypothetical protein